MYISQQLKNTNIAEYLLYMWQVEDLLRANRLDPEAIRVNIVEKYNMEEQQKQRLLEWYGELIAMMRTEGVVEKGHLQINKNIIILLTDLHIELLRSGKYPFYEAQYYKTLPYIVELRRKGSQDKESELQTCFEALYGVMMLKLQKKEISEETSRAIAGITGFISMLATWYHRDQKGERQE